MAQSNWEADKMLDVYIYDYLVKKKLHNTAKSFMTEGKVSPDPVAIDAPGGFLFEWWSVFWDIFIARTNEKHSENAAAYLETQQIKAKEQQLQMQQLQLMRHAQLQRRDPNHPPIGSPLNAITTEGVLGQSTATALAAKMYEDRMKNSNPMDTETSQPLLDARMALLKSTNHPGQMVQGNSVNVTAALQQMQVRTQQIPDIKSEVNMGNMQRSLPMDPSSIYGQGGMQSKSGITNAGLNQGVGGLTLKGWPLTGIEQIRPGFGAQVQKPLLQSANQFQLLPQQQQQQLLAQVHAQGNIGNSQVYGDMDPQRLRGLARGGLNVKDSQPIANDGSIGSPMQSTSSKINMPQMQQSISQQQQDALHPQQLGQSPFGMSHQQALAQVTAQAVIAQSHNMHMQLEYQPVSLEPPTERLVEQPSFTRNEALEQHVAAPVSESRNAQMETSEITHSDKKYQPSSLPIDKPADDGYNWRKYGQKQVKGSEYPRSYYKCTHLNCPVKKKVERAPDGHITEIIYKGQHNHEKPQVNKRVKENSDVNGNANVQPNSNSQGWVGNSNKSSEIVPVCSVPESDLISNQGASRPLLGSSEIVEVDDADDKEDGGDSGPNPKRRSIEPVVPEAPASQKTVTEPKIIVQTRSEVDLLDDGYRWRKYGQKVVKGNPHPRSYYKCTSAGCNVRKHVERASTDPKAVITTYEGKHNHDVPAARNSSHHTANSNSMPSKPQARVPEKHPLLKDMEFGNNDQRPVHLRLKEEQIIV